MMRENWQYILAAYVMGFGLGGLIAWAWRDAR